MLLLEDGLSNTHNYNVLLCSEELMGIMSKSINFSCTCKMYYILVTDWNFLINLCCVFIYGNWWYGAPAMSLT